MLNGQIFFSSYFFPEGRHLPEWISAVVPIEPTWLVLWLQASSSGVLGLWDCLLILVKFFFGGVDFLGSFPKVGALSLS